MKAACIRHITVGLAIISILRLPAGMCVTILTPSRKLLDMVNKSQISIKNRFVVYKTLIINLWIQEKIDVSNITV